MSEPQLGEFLGSYQLEEEIGIGGAARLFLARHMNPAYAENTFALKVLHAEVAKDAEFVSRFRQEAYLLSTLKHANIVDTFEAGIQGSELFIAMEYVDGRDFGDILDRHQGPIPELISLHIIREILEALHYAHTLTDGYGTPLGLVHLDVKPSNILLSYDGRVKLTDFGIASLLFNEAEDPKKGILGTKGYFAPEQLEGGSVDHRADVFSLGVVLYETLCGKAPFTAQRTAKVLKQNRKVSMPRPRKVNPNISPDVEAVILKALERKPQKRYRNCREMLDDLIPLAPHPSGMHLALGSLVRSVIALSDDKRNLWHREVRHEKFKGERVAFCVNDLNTQEKLLGDLQSIEVSMDFYSSPSDIWVADSERPIRALVVDIDDPGFQASELLSYQISTSHPVPVITICDTINTRSVAVADAIGAVNMLLRPLDPKVTRSAIKAALKQALSPVNRISQQNQSEPMEIRLMLVTMDPALGAKIATEFKPWGYWVDVVSTSDEAVARMDEASFKAIIYDQFPSGAVDPDFANRIRGLPGVGLVPILFLRDFDESGQVDDSLVLPERTDVRSRNASPVLFASSINYLRGMTRLGRTYTRFPMDGNAILSFRGHSMESQIVNISRGGILLKTGQMPALGTSCRVRIEPSMGLQEFTLRGMVVRLELDKSNEDGLADVGIEFSPNPPETECLLIELVKIITTQKAPLLTPPPMPFVGFVSTLPQD